MGRTTENGAKLRQMIQQKAATPKGFSIADGEKEGLTNGATVTSLMCAKGRLFKARVQTSTLIIRYFATIEAKQAFEKLYEGAIMAPKTRVVRVAAPPNRTALPTPNRTAPPKSHSTAEIVYAEDCIFTICPTHAPRFQAMSLPFQHGTMKAMS